MDTEIKKTELSMASRVRRIVIGFVAFTLLGIVTNTTGSLGYLGLMPLLPLLAIYPLLTGLLGEELFSLNLGFGSEKQQAQVPPVDSSIKIVQRTQKEAVAGHRTATTHQHQFGHGASHKAA